MVAFISDPPLWFMVYAAIGSGVFVLLVSYATIFYGWNRRNILVCLVTALIAGPFAWVMAALVLVVAVIDWIIGQLRNFFDLILVKTHNKK